MADSLEVVQQRMGVKAPRLPEAWFGSGEEKRLRERVATASRHTLLLDYDGTLAPFRADKMLAFPYAGVTEILEEIRQLPGHRVVLVTGRRAADLECLIPTAKEVEIWGSHGREHIDRNRDYTFYPPTVEQCAMLDTLQREIEATLRGVPLHLATGDLSITSHGSHPTVEAPEPLERKPASVAIHWRGLTAESTVLLQSCVESAYRLHGRASVERLPFESGVEFRATGYTKAFAVERELEQSRESDVIAYLGDDLTDEDAFAALNTAGMSFLVRPDVRYSRAKYWLRPPEDLLRFLTEWVSAS